MSLRSLDRPGVLVALATVGLRIVRLGDDCQRPHHNPQADGRARARRVRRLIWLRRGHRPTAPRRLPVRTAPDPLVDLQFDAATVRGFLDSIEGPKILVGHSYGGAVITQAASGDPDEQLSRLLLQ